MQVSRFYFYSSSHSNGAGIRVPNNRGARQESERFREESDREERNSEQYWDIWITVSKLKLWLNGYGLRLTGY